MNRWWVYLLLWALQATVVVLAVNASWVEQAMQKESDRVAAYLGADREMVLTDRAQSTYQRTFVESGAVAGSYQKLLPDRTLPPDGMDNLAPWFFAWVRDRLDTFWRLVYQGVFRWQWVSLWMPYGLPWFMAAVIDGLMRRQVRKQASGYANPVRYHAAWHGLTGLLLGFLLYLSVPLSLHPTVVIVGWIMLSGILSVLLANVQHRL